VGFYGKGAWAVNKLLPHLHPRGTYSSLSPYSEFSNKIYWQTTQQLLSRTNTMAVQILGFGCKSNSKCTVISSHGQFVTQSTHHNVVIHDGQLVTRGLWTMEAIGVNVNVKPFDYIYD